MEINVLKRVIAGFLLGGLFGLLLLQTGLLGSSSVETSDGFAAPTDDVSYARNVVSPLDTPTTSTAEELTGTASPPPEALAFIDEAEREAQSETSSETLEASSTSEDDEAALPNESTAAPDAIVTPANPSAASNSGSQPSPTTTVVEDPRTPIATNTRTTSQAPAAARTPNTQAPRSGPAARTPATTRTATAQAPAIARTITTQAPAPARTVTTRPPAPARTVTTRPPAPPRTTTTQTPTTTRPATTQAPTTTRPAATPPPVATRGGTATGTGCVANCRTVGFQDLRGQRDVTLENLIITNPDGRCLDLTGARNVTIRRVTFLSCGTDRALTDGYDTGLIQIVDAQGITIENSTIRNFSNEAFGGERNNAIQISGSSNIVIRSTWFKQINSDISDGQGDKGNRAIKVTGSMNGLTIDSNHFDDAGRNAVQISRLRGGERISITNNVIEGRGRWDSDYEDMINLFSSSGTASDPIHISGNTFRNGGPSRSGTGIILGDGNISSGPSQYILVENNRFIDPGHVGINLAGGNNITIRNNTIVGTGDVPHRTTTGFTINHFGYSTDCRDHVVTGNRVWMDNQHLSSGTNHAWVPQTCTSNVQLSGNIFGDETLR